LFFGQTSIVVNRQLFFTWSNNGIGPTARDKTVGRAFAQSVRVHTFASVFIVCYGNICVSCVDELQRVIENAKDERHHAETRFQVASFVGFQICQLRPLSIALFKRQSA
jgi:hypothetical protein